ncbi:MAG: response regulator [Candidatus Brocadiia bacterium]
MADEKLKIMVLDDEASIGDLLNKFLTKKNYMVTAFTSPKQALKHLKNNPVDLMITDMNMPEMNGLDVTKAAKTSNPDLPIIIMSSSCLQERKDEMAKLGVCDYIQKPLNLNYLESRIALNQSVDHR